MLSAKNCELFLQKSSVIDTVIGRVLNTPLRVYFHSLFILGTTLNLEFHILAELMLTGVSNPI